MTRLPIMLAAAIVGLFLLAEVRPTQRPIDQPAAEEQTERPAVQFAAYDVLIDPHGQGLAAYQIDVQLRDGASKSDVKIVGIEGGEGPAFAAAPYYDPRAMQTDRVILGAIASSLGSALPNERTRVARIHVMVRGELPTWVVTLQAAGDLAGISLVAHATVEKVEVAKERP